MDYYSCSVSCTQVPYLVQRLPYLVQRLPYLVLEFRILYKKHLHSASSSNSASAGQLISRTCYQISIVLVHSRSTHTTYTPNLHTPNKSLIKLFNFNLNFLFFFFLLI